MKPLDPELAWYLDIRKTLVSSFEDSRVSYEAALKTIDAQIAEVKERVKE